MDIVEALACIEEVALRRQEGIIDDGVDRSGLGFGVLAEQRAAAFFLSVDRSGVGAQQDPETTVERFSFQRWFCLHQKVEVVGHETVTEQIDMGQQVGAHFAEKKVIVASLEEDGLAVVALVVDVVDGFGRKVHHTWQGWRVKQVIRSVY